MLSIDKKAHAEVARLKSHIFCERTQVEGWSIKRCKYIEPGKYQFLENEEIAKPLGMNEHFGLPDITAFLSTHFEIPASMKGKKVALELVIGGEACVFVNKVPFQGLDVNRSLVYLTECAEGGETYDIEVEVYGKNYIIDEAKNFKTDLMVSVSQLLVFSPAVYDFYFDCQICDEYMNYCTEIYTHNRVLGLMYDALRMLDYHTDATLEESAKKASAYYHENLKKYKDIKIPLDLFCVGHSHIDLAWHWQLKETVRKTSRTFSTAMRLMEQYPEFRFSQSTPVLYEMAKRYYPDLYKQVLARIEEGRWEPVGSMYVEPDCNLISGESFVRQIMYGKQFYQKELGVDSNICFLPDVFGYSAAMPQILKKAGTDYFFTSKLTWQETNEFPYSVFNWQGIDGTQVLSGMIAMRDHTSRGLYSGDMTATGIYNSLDFFKNKEQDVPVMYLYGHGDGGGGVTSRMLETIRRLEELPFAPHVRQSNVSEYFAALDEKDNSEYPTWVGELYFEKHRGTYTTAAKNKRFNRKSEFAYRDAELLTCAAGVYAGKFTENDLHAGWKLILLNQFHDVLPGTSSAEVYKLTDEQYAQILEIGNKTKADSLALLAQPAQQVFSVYNTLGWSRSEVVAVAAPEGMVVADMNGVVVPQARNAQNEIAFMAANVPAMGAQNYQLVAGVAEAAAPSAVPETIETDYYSIVFNADGELVRLYDKTAGREVLKAGEVGNKFLLQEDFPVEWYSAWETTRMRDDRPSDTFTTTKITMAEDNDLYLKLLVEKDVSGSHIAQEIIIEKTSPLITFKTVVDWNECQKMLRVSFPVDVHSDKATCDIAFGNIEHTTHATTSQDEARFEVCAHKWSDVSEGSYGVALLNDSKYGYSLWNSNLTLSLLRAANYPSETCDAGVHEFTYSLYPHCGDAKAANIARVGYDVNVPMIVCEGSLPTQSLVSTDAAGVIIDTVKKAEDSDDIIVRIFETYHQSEKATLTFGFPVAACEECNLLEEKIEAVELQGNSISLQMKPYEIRTFKLTPASK